MAEAIGADQLQGLFRAFRDGVAQILADDLHHVPRLTCEATFLRELVKSIRQSLPGIAQAFGAGAASVERVLRVSEDYPLPGPGKMPQYDLHVELPSGKLAIELKYLRAYNQNWKMRAGRIYEDLFRLTQLSADHYSRFQVTVVDADGAKAFARPDFPIRAIFTLPASSATVTVRRDEALLGAVGEPRKALERLPPDAEVALRMVFADDLLPDGHHLRVWQIL